MKEIQPGDRVPLTMKKQAYVWRVVIAILFLLIHSMAIKNLVLLSRDLYLGDGSGERVRPAPQYGLYRIPASRRMRAVNAGDRLAIDFAQVYFPSKVFGELSKNYTAGEFDPFDRSSRYAPFVHYLCAISYCRLDYGPASLVHLYVQLILFYLSFTSAFFLLKITRQIPVGIMLVSAGLFLTPAGLSWFERGQFSLYVAMAYLFVILGVLKRKPVFFLLGGLFAFIKWTSFPTIFVILSTFLFASGNLKRLKENILLTVPFFATILLLLAVFPKNSLYFVQGLYQQEVFAHFGGISLVKLLPVGYVKLLPAALLVLGILHVRKYGDQLEQFLAFFTGTGILMLVYPTLVFDYSVSTLFGLIPFMIYWSKLPADQGQAAARTAMRYIFFLFLLAASYSPAMVRFFNSEDIMYWMYGLVAAIFLFVPLVPSFQGIKNIPAPKIT